MHNASRPARGGEDPFSHADQGRWISRDFGDRSPGPLELIRSLAPSVPQRERNNIDRAYEPAFARSAFYFQLPSPRDLPLCVRSRASLIEMSIKNPPARNRPTRDGDSASAEFPLRVCACVRACESETRKKKWKEERKGSRANARNATDLSFISQYRSRISTRGADDRKSRIARRVGRVAGCTNPSNQVPA